MRVPLFWEQATWKNYFASFGSGSKPSLTDILTLAWAALKNGGSKLTLAELADKLTDKDLQELSVKVMQLASNNSSKQGEGTAPLDKNPRN